LSDLWAELVFRFDLLIDKQLVSSSVVQRNFMWLFLLCMNSSLPKEHMPD